jgi:hypothetical protein
MPARVFRVVLRKYVAPGHEVGLFVEHTLEGVQDPREVIERMQGLYPMSHILSVTEIVRSTDG